jgi:peroxiredoxin Q/BCP
MAKIQPGDVAPNFSATTYDGVRVSLSDYLGKRGVVLFFYPKDGTSICTKEACAFRDSYEKFTQVGFEVIGVSSDSDESHRTFAQEHHLSFPLISDADGSLRKAFGVPKTLGLIPGRVTYVIDKEGTVRHIFSAQFASDEHVEQAMKAILLGLKIGVSVETKVKTGPFGD